MLHDLSDLFDAPLETRSGKGFLRDIFFDRRSGQLRLVAVETPYPDHREALIDAARLSTPIHEGGAWTLEVDEDDLAAAPHWPEVLEREQLDLSTWPLVVIGPFGNSFAPLMALTALRSEMAEGAEPELGDDSADALVAPLEQARDWIGVQVFGRDGELGRLAALLFEPATRTIRIMRLDHTPEGGPVDLPLSVLRYRAEAGGHLVLDASLADLRAAAEAQAHGTE